MVLETELEMVQRHIRQGHEHVSRQASTIVQMALKNQSTELAEALPLSFERCQQAHQDHLDRLISAGPPAQTL